MLHDELHEGAILLIELRRIEVFVAFVALLIEVHGAYPELRRLKVGRCIYHKVVGAHIAEQAHEAALVELYKLLGDADLIEGNVIIEVLLHKYVARYAWDVLFDQRMAIVEKAHPIGRKEVLQL